MILVLAVLAKNIKSAMVSKKAGIDYIGVGVGAVLINEEGKYFTALRGKEVRSESGKWEFPGGAVEFGETFESTLIREMKEEHDVDIIVGELLDVCDHIIPQEHQHWVASTFLCKIEKGELKIVEPHKCDEIGWFTFRELEQMPLSIITKKIFIRSERKGFRKKRPMVSLYK
jgi:8-oxo-dGTP diphosphatase